MPEISRFYGIVVAMFWRDHLPPTSMLTMQDRKRRSGWMAFYWPEACRAAPCSLSGIGAQGT